MKKPILIGAGSFAAAAAAIVLFGTAVAAAAPDVVGETYADASAAISDEGLTAVVAAKVGDKVSQEDCVVTGATEPSFLNANGESTGDYVWLTLNCYATAASPNSPGWSAASPEGRQAIADAEAAAQESEAAEESNEDVPAE